MNYDSYLVLVGSLGKTAVYEWVPRKDSLCKVYEKNALGHLLLSEIACPYDVWRNPNSMT